jgi:hypothetical protein
VKLIGNILTGSFVLFILFCCPLRSDGQKMHSFKEILSVKTINKTFVNQSKEDTTWRTYLGKITDSKYRTIYYVISEFNKIKAAVTWHGHSNVYFFNRKEKFVARFDMELPENLPIRLQKNTLYFKDKGNAGKIHGVKITSPLQKFICVGPNECGEAIFER